MFLTLTSSLLLYCKNNGGGGRLFLEFDIASTPINALYRTNLNSSVPCVRPITAITNVSPPLLPLTEEEGTSG